MSELSASASFYFTFKIQAIAKLVLFSLDLFSLNRFTFTFSLNVFEKETLCGYPLFMSALPLQRGHHDTLSWSRGGVAV